MNFSLEILKMSINMLSKVNSFLRTFSTVSQVCLKNESDNILLLLPNKNLVFPKKIKKIAT
jgi:hypothetical protein